MSDIKNLIRETNKNAKRSRLINNVLWGVVLILMMVAMYTTNLSISTKNEAVAAKNEAIQERDAKEKLLVVADSLTTQAEILVTELEVSEGNLQLEKDKLELIKVKYDSLRQITINQKDDLWEYAIKENTLEAYSDYVNIKGINDEVVSKIKTLLRKTGYVQIQESNGNMLIEPINKQYGLWKTKSTRSIRYGVIGKSSNSARNGDAILRDQPFVILEDSLWSGKTRWAKVAY
tara:strand:+ start:21743 stop:22441 length:699 start_codon:yes stop_codon:yes gene_type:complete